MRIFNTAHELYNSTEFRTLRQNLILTRMNKDGVLICSFCGKPILKDYQTIAHHKTEVTTANLNNPEITLNPDNIELVHLHCHNEIHGRFGAICKKVYFVHGAPLAGKSSFVQSEKARGDLVVDIDLIWQAITGGEKYDKPNSLIQNVFGLYTELLEMVKTRAGKWTTAYIISAEARKAKRDRIAAEVNAELIYIPATREECLRRLESDTTRDHVRELWAGYINNYFDNQEI